MALAPALPVLAAALTLAAPIAAPVPPHAPAAYPVAPLTAAPLPGTAFPRAAPGWRWPLDPRPEVVHPFAVGPNPWSPGHRGVDLAAAPGATVLSPATGTVLFVGVVAGRPVLTVDHGGGLVSSFEPLVASVAVGASVAAGAALGHLSALPGHCDPASCLHWGVRRDGVYVDPLALLGARRPIVLKPVLSN